MAKDKLESEFQPRLKDEIKKRLPDCTIIKQDPNTSFQGVPDLLVLNGPNWALLETKRRPKSARQPNQDFYVDKFNEQSFSAFVTPENMDEVLDALQESFRTGR